MKSKEEKPEEKIIVEVFIDIPLLKYISRRNLNLSRIMENALKREIINGLTKELEMEHWRK